MKFLSLCLFFVGVVAINSFKIDSTSKEEHDGVYVKIEDFLKHFKPEKMNNLLLDGKMLNLELVKAKRHVPVLLFGENGKTELDHESFHELYHDALNNATFTVSTFKKADGTFKKSLRGSVVSDDSELVVDPVSLGREKRDADSTDDVHVKIYKRNIVELKNKVDQLLEQYKVPKTKRQTTGKLEAFVETLAICDFHCYNQHASYMKSTDKNTIANHVEGYLAHVMNIADLHYQRSFEKDTQLKINLYTNTYVILTTPEASKFTTEAANFMTVNSNAKDALGRQYVNGDVSLGNFNDWLVAQKDANVLPNYDIAVAFTYANLFTPSADLLGIAPMGGACSAGRNGVLVEDSGRFASGSTTAHEMAHNLGVAHDVNMNSATCTDDMNYVMSTSNKATNRLNSFYFSGCSISQLKDYYLNKKQFQCTYNSAAKAADYVKFISVKPGQLYNANEQCKQALGPTAKLMTGNKSGGGTFEESMCETLWCTTDYRSATTASAAAEGTSCGNGKWCVQGVCTASSAAPTGTCLTEDDATFCNDFLTKYGQQNLCLNYKNGPCCKMCGGTPINKLYDIKTWLAGNTLDNVKFLDKAAVPPCVDKYTWCPTQIATWKQSTPDICTGGYTVSSTNEPIKSVCRKACALC